MDIPAFPTSQFIKKLKRGVKDLKINKIIGFERYSLRLLFLFNFQNNKNSFLSLKIFKLI